MDGPEREACYELNRDFMERMKLEAAQAARARAAKEAAREANEAANKQAKQ